MTFLSSQVGMGSNRHVDGLALLMIEVSTERCIREKQSRVRSGLEEDTEAVETPTEIGGLSWLTSSLILIIFLLKKLTKSSLLRAAGMQGSTEL